MKVVLLSPLPPPYGGIASWTVRMLKTKLKKNWKVDVVDEKVIGNRDLFGDKRKRNIFIEIKRNFRIWKNLYNKLKDKEVKIVHSNIPAGTYSMLRELICLIITKYYKRKFIIHYRCTIPNLVKGKISLLIFRLLTNASDAAITLNSISANFVKKYSNTPVYLIPNFIENSSLMMEKRLISKKINKAVYVGGVIKEKGCLEIIEASKHFLDIEFRLIGKVSKEIKNSAKNNNVVFLGELNREEVDKELRNADIFLFPSYFPGEGFSNALLEAMAVGLPCIASKWAANEDMIENKGGIIIPIKDSKSLIEAIKSMEDKSIRKSMSDWNVQKVKNYYTEKIVTDKYVDLYELLIK